MKFDLLDLFQHYDLFFEITGDKTEAVVMYVWTTIFIFCVAFFTVRALFYNGLKFKGKKKVMKIAFATISYFVTDCAYKFLEKFTTPLAWLYKYWWVVLIGIFIFSIVCGVISIIIEERKEKKNAENNIINGN